MKLKHEFMPPSERTIHEPEGGWVEQAYYVVEIAMFSSNPIHIGIFFTGFLNGGNAEEKLPGGYHGMMYVPGEDTEFHGLYGRNRIHYLKPLHLIMYDKGIRVELKGKNNVPTIDDEDLPRDF